MDNIYWHDEMLGDTTYIETTTQENLKTTTGNQGRNPAAIGLIFLGVAVRTMSAVARIEAHDVGDMTKPDVKELLHEMYSDFGWLMSIIEDYSVIAVCVSEGKGADLIAGNAEMIDDFEWQVRNVFERPDLTIWDEIQRLLLFKRIKVGKTKFRAQAHCVQLDGSLP